MTFKASCELHGRIPDALIYTGKRYFQGHKTSSYRDITGLVGSPVLFHPSPASSVSNHRPPTSMQLYLSGKECKEPCWGLEMLNILLFCYLSDIGSRVLVGMQELYGPEMNTSAWWKKTGYAGFDQDSSRNSSTPVII